MVSQSFHLPTHIPVTILMLLFLLSPGSKRSGNPAGFTSNEHPDFGRSLPLRAAAVALATIVAPWDCCGCFPGPLLLPSPRKVGLHTPSLGQATFLLCLKPSQGSPLPCCQCQDLVMAWEALQHLVCLFLGSVSLTSSPNIADIFLPQGPCTYCLPALEHSPGIHMVPLWVSAPVLCFLSASFPDLPVWQHPSSSGSLSPFSVAVRPYSLV